MSEYKVEMTDISKRFGGVVALNGVSFNVKPGEIHALMGENGAGKSTLMKILAGSLKRDSGEIKIDGQPVQIRSPKEGMDNGIAIIYQELMMVPDISVAENIFIDKLGGKFGFVNWKQMRKKAQEALNELGFSEIEASEEVGNLTVAYQQVVEICKALSRNSRVLILDEPTAVLSNKEVEKLFGLLTNLRAQGVAIIYISHRLEEVFRLCDRITVMKDGKFVATVNTCDVDKDKLVNLMIGRDLADYFPERSAEIGPVILKVEHLNAGKMVKDVSFEVREGEVLGISGLVGAGRTESMRAIMGEDKRDSGDIYLEGQKVNIRSPRDAIKNKVGLLPEDRKNHGVLLNLSLRYNMSLGRMKSLRAFPMRISKKKEDEYLDGMVKKLSIRTASLDNMVSSLSGGNQQKVAIAKLLASDCKVLLFDEPTRGVDVGSKREIYTIINSFVEQKYAVVMISSEMPEIIGMCDRVVVMREGQVAGEVSGDEINEENLIRLSMGLEGA